MENPMSTQLTHSSPAARVKRRWRTGLPALRRLVLILAAYVVFAAPAHADRPTLAGSWSASALRSDWNIGDWGASCGPKPSSGGDAASAVRITTAGNELLLQFPSRSYSTTQCWEQYPGLVRSSHVAGARSWRNVCKTNPSDPRQAAIVTTISATDTQLSFDETGQYQFVLQGQNCTASVRRTRTLTLVQRDGEAPAATAKPQTAASTERVAKQPRCASNGLPERLEVRPSRKLMRPGETFTFRATVVDAVGCPLQIAPTWRVVGRTGSVQLSGAGKVSVADDAAEGEVQLQATVADRSVPLVVEVVSRERYDALLERQSLNAEGESSDAAVARVTSSIGSRGGVVVQPEESRGKRFAFVAVIGGLSLALGVLGLLVMRRAKRAEERHSRAQITANDPGFAQAATSVPIKICPTCREEYPGEAIFCASDGNRLVVFSPANPLGPTGGVCPVCAQGYDPGVAVCPKHGEPLVPAPVQMELRRSAAIGHRICPVCGTQFDGDSQFCGKCGAALVPVN